MEITFFLNQHNFLVTKGMVLFFIYLCTELKFFVVLWFTRYIGGRPKFDLKSMPNSE